MILASLTHAREPVAFTTFEAWWAATAPLRVHPSTVDRAIAQGFASDRLGMAFAGGYCSAMIALGAPDDGTPSALCATEDEGGHPRAIKTRLESGRVTGTKRFVSFGTFAKHLLVVASEGASEGRNRLRVVQVAASDVTLDPGMELPFVPEVPHASVVLENVAGQVLPGDGYERYLKPFRTIEDLHVNAAVLAYLLNVGLRFGWSNAAKEDLLAALASAVTLGSMEPSSIAAHRTIGGLLGNATRIIDSLDWSGAEPGERARFERDRPLLEVASKARAARRLKAWR